MNKGVMHDTSPAHRAMCSTCLRPQKTCICAWVTPVQHHVEVLILQHPLEAANPKGSARLLHLCLPHSRLVVEEVFEEQALRQLLTGPWSALRGDAPPNTQYTVQPLLLYPATPGKAAQPRPDWLGDAAALALPISAISALPPMSPMSPMSPKPLRLVVLDGTWRKSRKMLHLNPALQHVLRLPLHDLPASRYRIRQAHQPDQRSTLEATCAALMQLEGQSAPFLPLLTAFEGFVAQQMGYAGIHQEPV